MPQAQLAQIAQSLVLLDPQVRLDQLALREQQVQTALFLVRRVLQGLRGQQEQQVLQGHKVFKE